MSEQMLNLAVVGHTNTGKTSLLRTLTRDPTFGEVRDSPGTTRHVEGASLRVDGQPLLALYDTPGLEDSMALLDYLEQHSASGERLDGPERIARFLASPVAQTRFEQEARVLQKLLASDAGLYVIDVRDPVLSKHKDELFLLSLCGRPLLPVLNFMHSEQARTQEWRQALARLGLHALAEFDTVAPALDGEAVLYDKLAVLLETHAGLLKTVKLDLLQQATQRRHAAMRLLAELLIDAAALCLRCEDDEGARNAATVLLQERLVARENTCVRAMLQCYNFGPRDVLTELPHFDGQHWGMDLFDPEAVKEFGVRVGKGMAAGAVAGATVDVLTGGLSLGMGTMLGAVAGGMWQGAESWGGRLLGKLRGEVELRADESVLRLLAVRQLRLVHALERRGHAAQQPIQLSTAQATYDQAEQLGEQVAWRERTLPEALRQARAHPAWSTLDPQYVVGADERREQAIQRLLAQLLTP